MVIYIYIYDNEMCQHLEDVYNLVNRYFPDDQYMKLQSHDCIKDQFKFYARPMNSNITGYKGFVDMGSDSTWQPTFKKPPLVEFW